MFFGILCVNRCIWQSSGGCEGLAYISFSVFVPYVASILSGIECWVISVLILLRNCILIHSLQKEDLFKDADKNGDGAVSIDELAALLAFHQEKYEKFILGNIDIQWDPVLVSWFNLHIFLRYGLIHERWFFPSVLWFYVLVFCKCLELYIFVVTNCEIILEVLLMVMLDQIFYAYVELMPYIVSPTQKWKYNKYIIADIHETCELRPLIRIRNY